MAPLDEPMGQAPYKSVEKDLYEVGEIPPMGYVPKQ
ncbi:MAG: crotonyl-CoA carboxylase/reductase, partial [Paracoccaceae bacterium]